MTSILLVELVGVMVADKVVSATVVFAEERFDEELIPVITCITEPAGIEALAIPLDDVVTVPAKVAFCAVLSVSAVVPLLVFSSNAPVVSAVCTSAVPDVVPAEMLDAMMYP
jgi:hypothetical protein